MLRADPVMDTDQPRLEISEDEMDDGQELLGYFGIAAFGNGMVIVAAFPQAGVTAPIVRDDQRPRSDGAIDKPTKRFGATVSGNCQPNAPRIAPILSLILRGSRVPMAHLNGAGDRNLVVNASAFAACPTADPGFVHLDMLVRAATDAILVRTDHSGAQFVEDLKGCLVTREPKLPLELDGRHAGGLAGDQVGGPEPDVASLHDRADSQSCLTSAFAACQHARAGRNAERFASRTTMRTDLAVFPACLFEGIQRRRHRPGRAAETQTATAETAARRAGRCPSRSAWARS